MLYQLNRGLFVENGPTVLDEQAREALAVSNAYLLLRGRQPGAPPASETAPLSAAA